MADIVTGSKVERKKILKAATMGDGRSGKTHFTTTAPKPIGLVPMDANSIATYKRVEEEYGMEGDFYYPKHEILSAAEVRKLMRPINMAWTMRQENMGGDGKAKKHSTDAIFAQEEEVKKVYRAKIEQVNDLVHTYCEHKDIRTVVMDTGMQWYEWMMSAHFGRQASVDQKTRGPLNEEMRGLILSTTKHLLITHPMQPVYENNKIVPGRMKIDGWPRIVPSMNVCVEHFKIDDRVSKRQFLENLPWTADAEEYQELEAMLDEYPKFGIKVFDCQSNPVLSRDSCILLGEMNTFSELAQRVFPGTTAKDWK